MIADRSKSEKKQKTGATLVETIVGLVLLAVFIAGAGRLLLSNRGLSDISREHYTAINIAKNRIEEARTFGFDSIDNFAESNREVDVFGVPEDGGRYRRTSEISTITTNRLIEMTVTVEVRDHRTHQFGDAKQVVQSYIANPN